MVLIMHKNRSWKKRDVKLLRLCWKDAFLLVRF